MGTLQSSRRERAAQVAVTTVGLVLPRLAVDMEVVVCCFTENDLETYRALLG